MSDLLARLKKARPQGSLLERLKNPDVGRSEPELTFDPSRGFIRPGSTSVFDAPPSPEKAVAQEVSQEREAGERRSELVRRVKSDVALAKGALAEDVPLLDKLKDAATEALGGRFEMTPDGVQMAEPTTKLGRLVEQSRSQTGAAIGSGVGDMAQGIAMIPEAVTRKMAPGSLADDVAKELREAARVFGRATADITKAEVQPEFQESFAFGTMPQAGGSALSFLGGGGALRALGLGPKLSAALAGMSQAGAQGYEEALEATNDEDVAWKAYVLNFGVGASEAAGIGRVLSRVNKRTKGALSRVLLNMGRESTEEGAQEFAQTVAQNLIARNLYDEDREILQGAAEGGLAGFLLGGGISGAVSLSQQLAGQDQPSDLSSEPVEGEEVATAPVQDLSPPIEDLSPQKEPAPAEASPVAEPVTAEAPKRKPMRVKDYGQEDLDRMRADAGLDPVPVEPPAGVEPATTELRTQRSTVEPQGQVQESTTEGQAEEGGEAVRVGQESTEAQEGLRRDKATAVSLHEGAQSGDLDRRWHLNEVLARMSSRWGEYVPKGVDPEEYAQGWDLWKDEIANVVASIPKQKARNAAKGGSVQDPLLAARLAFPDGTATDDIPGALQRANMLVERYIFGGEDFVENAGRSAGRRKGKVPASKRAGLARDYENALELLGEFGLEVALGPEPESGPTGMTLRTGLQEEPDLGTLSRRELQDRAKAAGIRANQSSEAIRKELRKQADEPDLLYAGFPNPGKVIAEGASYIAETDEFRWLRRTFQDHLAEVIRWTKANVEVVSDKLDLMAHLRVWRGKAKHRSDQMRDRYINPLIEQIGKNNWGVRKDWFGDGKNRTLADAFLIARHVPERNAQLEQGLREGKDLDPVKDGGGMSTVDAKKFLRELARRDDWQALQAFGRRWDRMNRSKLRQMHADGLIPRKAYDTLRNTYKHWAPLKTYDPNEEWLGIGRGTDIRGQEFKRAFGRSTISDNPFEFGILGTYQGIIRGEKNKAMQPLLEIAEAHPDLVEVNKAKMTRALGKDGVVRDVPDLTALNDDDVVGVKRDGVMHFIRFKGPDAELLGRALKNSDVMTGGELVQQLGRATRFYSALATRWNPVFPVFNLIRDAGGAFVTYAGEKGIGAGFAMGKRIPKMLFAAHKEFRNPGQKGEVYNTIREYESAGGRIAFLDLDNIGDLIRKTARLIKEAQKGANASKLRKHLRAMGDAFAALNDAVEMGVRLAVYEDMRKRGASPLKAAEYSKGVTTNFEIKGNVGPAMNALFAFSNAGIQGNARIVEALTHKGVQRLVGSAAAFAMLQPYLWTLFGHGDEWDEIPDWEKETNFIIPVPRFLGGKPGERVKIPLPFVYRWFHSSGVKLGEWTMQKRSTRDLVAGTSTSLFNELNPLAETKSVQNVFTPTLARPVAEAIQNKNFAGQDIAPLKFNKNDPTPDSYRYWPDTNSISVNVAQALNRLTFGDEATSGLIDISPNTLEHLFTAYTSGLGKTIARTGDATYKAATGDDVYISDIPLIRRLYTDDEPRQERAVFYKYINDIIGLEAKRKQYEAVGNREMAREVRRDPMYRLVNRAKDMKSKAADLNKRRLSARTKERAERYEDRLFRLHQRFNIAVRRAKE